MKSKPNIPTLDVDGFSREDQFHLQAASGWLGLKNYAEANHELDEIKPENRVHPAVLSLRYDIYAKAEKWDMASVVADALTRMMPDEPNGWICLAYSTRRKSGGGIPKAKDILLKAEPKFPKIFLFPYNLACYCSQLSEFDDARTWIKKAMAINDKAVKKIAVDDPDLKPLWDNMNGTFWNKG
jgi:hypothetical protein